MPRTILIHLNVTVPDDDDRTTDEIIAAVCAMIEVVSDHDSVRDLAPTVVLAEEV